MRIGLFLIMFVIFSLSCSAFQLRDYSTNEITYQSSLFDIDEKYFIGIKAIRIITIPNKLYDGYYYIGGVIDIYNNQFTKELILHELAHHCQWMKRDTVYNISNHKGKFSSCLTEVST